MDHLVVSIEEQFRQNHHPKNRLHHFFYSEQVPLKNLFK